LRAFEATPPWTSPERSRLAPPPTVANIKGVSAQRDSTEQTLIYLLSDNNFFILQRSLLIIFERRNGQDDED